MLASFVFIPCICRVIGIIFYLNHVLLESFTSTGVQNEKCFANWRKWTKYSNLYEHAAILKTRKTHRRGVSLRGYYSNIWNSQRKFKNSTQNMCIYKAPTIHVCKMAPIQKVPLKMLFQLELLTLLNLERDFNTSPGVKKKETFWRPAPLLESHSECNWC